MNIVDMCSENNIYMTNQNKARLGDDINTSEARINKFLQSLSRTSSKFELLINKKKCFS